MFVFYFSNFPNLILLPIFITLILLVVYFIYTYKRVHYFGNNRLNIIYTELKKEKEIASKLTIISDKVSLIETTTNRKINKVKVGILNLDFTLHEIFH